MSLSDVPLFALNVFFVVLGWVFQKFADFGAWSREPLTGGWAFAGLTFVWIMHARTREKIAALSRQVERLQNQVTWFEDRMRGGG